MTIATRGWRRRNVLLLTIVGFLLFNSTRKKRHTQTNPPLLPTFHPIQALKSGASLPDNSLPNDVLWGFDSYNQQLSSPIPYRPRDQHRRHEPSEADDLTARSIACRQCRGERGRKPSQRTATNESSSWACWTSRARAPADLSAAYLGPQTSLTHPESGYSLSAMMRPLDLGLWRAYVTTHGRTTGWELDGAGADERARHRRRRERMLRTGTDAVHTRTRQPGTSGDERAHEAGRGSGSVGVCVVTVERTRPSVESACCEDDDQRGKRSRGNTAGRPN